MEDSKDTTDRKETTVETDTTDNQDDLPLHIRSAIIAPSASYSDEDLVEPVHPVFLQAMGILEFIRDMKDRYPHQLATVKGILEITKGFIEDLNGLHTAEVVIETLVKAAGENDEGGSAATHSNSNNKHGTESLDGEYALYPQ